MKKPSTWIWIGLLAVTGFASGCGKQQDLMITYKQPCMTDTAGQFVEKTVAFVGVEVTTTIQYFFENTCTNALHVIEAHTKTDTPGSIAASTDASASTVLKLNTIQRYTTWTVVNPGALATFNAGQCGFTDWATNVPKDVTGMTCANGVSFNASGHATFAVQRFDGNNLYLYDFNATNPLMAGILGANRGLTDDTRITALEYVGGALQPYVRQ